MKLTNENKLHLTNADITTLNRTFRMSKREGRDSLTDAWRSEKTGNIIVMSGYYEIRFSHEPDNIYIRDDADTKGFRFEELADEWKARCTLKATLPSIDAIKRALKKEGKYNKTIHINNNDGTRTYVNARYLIDILTLVPDAEFYTDPSFRYHYLYFKGKNIDGVLLPITEKNDKWDEENEREAA